MQQLEKEHSQFLETVKNWAQQLGNKLEAYLSPIMKSFKETMEEVKLEFKKPTGSISDFNKAISEIISDFRAQRTLLLADSTKLKKVIADLINQSKKYPIFKYLAKIVEGLDHAINKMANFFSKIEGAFGKVKAVIDSIEHFFDSILKVIDMVLNFPKKVQEFITHFIEVIERIKDKFLKLWDFLNSIFQKIFNIPLSDILKSLINMFGTIVGDVVKIIKNVFGTIWGAIKKLSGSIWDIFSGDKDKENALNNNLSFADVLNPTPLLSSSIFSNRAGDSSQSLSQQTYINITSSGSAQDIANQVVGRQTQVNENLLRNLKGIMI